MTIVVKVMQVPGAVTEVALENGATVSDALSAASISDTTGYQLTVNGAETNSGNALRDGDRVILAKSAKSA